MSIATPCQAPFFGAMAAKCGDGPLHVWTVVFCLRLKPQPCLGFLHAAPAAYVLICAAWLWVHLACVRCCSAAQLLKALQCQLGAVVVVQ